MPLISGAKAKTNKGFSANVKKEVESGKPVKQSVAIAYSKAGESRKKMTRKSDRGQSGRG